MLQIAFTEKDKEVLKHERYHHPHPRVQQKMEVLWLKSQNLPHWQICELADISENTLRKYFRAYQEGGVEKLKEINVLAALNAVTHEVITVTNDTYITGTQVCELLCKLAALGLMIPITLVLDNARYQKCQIVQALADALHIELLYLPPYSPNLNLIERLWKFA